jgi:hypothetical protein
MSFYSDIAHQLYTWKTKIGETKFSSPFDFIEAKHNEAPYKGKVFYENLIHAMPNHFGAKMRNDFFKEVLQYCKQKIDEIELVNTNEANKEKGYFIQHEDLMKIRKNAQYLSVENHFKNKPYIIRNQQHEVVAQVFLPLLVYIFNCEDVPYTDFDKSKKQFNGKLFQKCYIESYSKGKIDFAEDFKLSNDTLYNNSDTYIRNLHYNYFHANIKGPQTWSNNEGWNYWKNENPLLINNAIIAEYGYYSAFIAGVLDLATKHPKLFETFSVCEHKTDSHKQETENIEKDEPIEETNNFCSKMPLNFARKHFKVFVDTDSNNKSKFLTDTQFEVFIQRAFLGNQNTQKQKMNIGTRETQFIVRRFYEFYTEAIKELYENQQSRDKFIKLLTDNFENWEFEKVKSNFNKPVKRKW